jgi:hypothetical protein
MLQSETVFVESAAGGGTWRSFLHRKSHDFSKELHLFGCLSADVMARRSITVIGKARLGVGAIEG